MRPSNILRWMSSSSGALVAGIDAAVGAQPLELALVDREPLRLADGRGGDQPEPVEIGADRVDMLLAAALEIGIVDPQQEASADLRGEQIIMQRGADIADVEAPGRRRGEAGGDGHVRPIAADPAYCAEQRQPCGRRRIFSTRVARRPQHLGPQRSSTANDFGQRAGSATRQIGAHCRDRRSRQASAGPNARHWVRAAAIGVWHTNPAQVAATTRCADRSSGRAPVP